jgi:hypothetical protein
MGFKGVYPINAVDEVTQWQVVSLYTRPDSQPIRRFGFGTNPRSARIDNMQATSAWPGCESRRSWKPSHARRPAVPPASATPKADCTRGRQLQVLVDRTQARLLVADQSAQPMAMRSASHVLIAGEALLNCWPDHRNHDDEEISEDDDRPPSTPSSTRPYCASFNPTRRPHRSSRRL